VGGHDESTIRKAYFRLAQKYHPDKNPEGRVGCAMLFSTLITWVVFCLVQEIFEKVNKAYEFLCSRAKITEGPDPKNIVLILQAQSILFSRYADGMVDHSMINFYFTICLLQFLSLTSMQGTPCSSRPFAWKLAMISSSPNPLLSLLQPRSFAITQ
jgi:DnaJ family protein C protein 13